MPQAAISHGTILAWQIVTVMGILVMLVAMVLWMRAHYVKITRGKLLVQVKPDAGRGYQELCEYTKGVCTVPEKKKRGRKERSRQEAVVSKTACWTIDYPQNYPAFVQAQVDKWFSEKAI